MAQVPKPCMDGTEHAIWDRFLDPEVNSVPYGMLDDLVASRKRPPGEKPDGRCIWLEPATRLELVTPALRERCSTN